MTSPIIETNIERILEDHLPEEVKLLEQRIQDLQQDIMILEDRRKKLLRIGEVAGISWPHPS